MAGATCGPFRSARIPDFAGMVPAGAGDRAGVERWLAKLLLPAAPNRFHELDAVGGRASAHAELCLLIDEQLVLRRCDVEIAICAVLVAIQREIQLGLGRSNRFGRRGLLLRQDPLCREAVFNFLKGCQHRLALDAYLRIVSGAVLRHGSTAFVAVEECHSRRSAERPEARRPQKPVGKMIALQTTFGVQNQRTGRKRREPRRSARSQRQRDAPRHRGTYRYAGYPFRRPGRLRFGSASLQTAIKRLI